MRVAIGAVQHKSNSFSPIPTPLASFHPETPELLEGELLLQHARGAKTALGGFLDVAAERHWSVVGTIGALAMPSGTVPAAVYDELKHRLVQRIRAAAPLDGVLLYLHGAMCSESAPDAETDLCREVRSLIGPSTPLVIELDLHGNITAGLCDAVDAVFAFKTNPHVDIYERGIEAARCLALILDGKVSRPRTYISKPPMLPPTITVRTSEEPMRTLIERALRWEAEPGVINASVLPGFPYADVPGAGTSIVVTATDDQIGQACADDLGRAAWELRPQFIKPLPTVPEAVAQALAIVASPGKGPVILADVADNPGGGGSGDTTALLHELVRRQVTGAVGCLWDPESVRHAQEIGIGGEGQFQLGGKIAPAQYGGPLEVQGRVTHLRDGRFVGRGPLLRGATVDLGPTACIDVAGLKFVVTTARRAANERGYFRVVGINPESEPLLVIKSRGHFRADFEASAQAIIEVDAPGAANPNLARYAFQAVRLPIWPLDPVVVWDGAPI